MFEEYFSLADAGTYVSWTSLVFLLEAVILLWIGKLIRDMFTPYSINQELTANDNKALATSFVGYMIGQGIIILGVLTGPSTDFYLDLRDVAIWSLVGIILLNLAMICNDKFLLRKFNNTKEIIEDRNVGTGAVQAGTHIGMAFVIRAVVVGDSNVFEWLPNLVGMTIFFIVGQLGFIVFSLIYQMITKYDVHEEVEKDNVAAGVSFGFTLAAIGIIMSNTISDTKSLAAFGVWLLTGLVLLVITRFMVDKLILPNHKLDSEIAKDRNWGAALIEGGGALIVALMLNTLF